MKSREKTQAVTPTNESVEKVEPVDADENAPTPVAETVIDPKEEARRRSKEDLKRKRQRLHNSGGKF